MRKRKHLMVNSGIHDAVVWFAERKRIGVQEMTRVLLGEALSRLAGLTAEQLSSEKAMRKAFRASETPTRTDDRMRLRLQLPRGSERHLVVSPEMHLAVSLYAQLKGLAIHEAAIFLLRSSLTGLITDEDRDPRRVDPLTRAFEQINRLEL